MNIPLQTSFKKLTSSRLTLPILLPILLASSSHASIQWLPADDNISGAPYSVTNISSWHLHVSNTTDGPQTDNGFTVDISAVGGNFDLALATGLNLGSRFDFTNIAGLSSITIDVNFDYFASPANPDDNPHGIEALAWMRWQAGSDIIGDLTFKSPTVAITNPKFESGASNGTYNGANNFTLDPDTSDGGGNDRNAGVYSLDNQTSNGAIAGFTLVVTPQGGGTFAANSRFLHTFDGLFTDTPVPSVPEPSSTALLGLGVLSLALRRRK